MKTLMYFSIIKFSSPSNPQTLKVLSTKINAKKFRNYSKIKPRTNKKAYLSSKERDVVV
jgi:hypothetical protein